MLGGFVANSVNAALEATPFAKTETFENPNAGYSPARMALVSLVTVTVLFFALLFVGKWLWNNVLHELVPAVKPAKSVWQILGLALLISLMNPGPCHCA